MWSNLALVLQCLVAWLGASVGASYLPLASWDLYLDTLHTVLFKHLEGAWAWSPASALLDGLLGVAERAVLHTTFHAVFISVLVLRLGANAVLAKWVGCAYLFGAWFVLASGLYLGSVNAKVAETLTLTVAIVVVVVVALTLALALTRRQMRCHSRRPTRMHDATTNPSPRPNYVSSTPTPTPTPNPPLTRYTTPWHWLFYALAGQRDLAYPILVYNPLPNPNPTPSWCRVRVRVKG